MAVARIRFLWNAFYFCMMNARESHRQGQKFVAVFKAKNRGAATSQNAKNRGIVAVKIVKIAAMSRQKSRKSRLCRGKNCKYGDDRIVGAAIFSIA